MAWNSALVLRNGCSGTAWEFSRSTGTAAFRQQFISVYKMSSARWRDGITVRIDEDWWANRGKREAHTHVQGIGGRNMVKSKKEKMSSGFVLSSWALTRLAPHYQHFSTSKFTTTPLQVRLICFIPCFLLHGYVSIRVKNMLCTICRMGAIHRRVKLWITLRNRCFNILTVWGI